MESGRFHPENPAEVPRQSQVFGFNNGYGPSPSLPQAEITAPGTETQPFWDQGLLPTRVSGAPEASETSQSADFVSKTVEAGLWAAADVAAHLIAPGVGQLVPETFRAVKIISAVAGMLDGGGFIFQLGLAELPGTGTCIALRIREGAASRHAWPEVTVGVDVNFLKQLEMGAPDVDGAAPHEVADWQEPVPPWPGEWTVQYGMRGVHDHQAVLNSRGIERDLEILDKANRPTNVNRWIGLIPRQA